MTEKFGFVPNSFQTPNGYVDDIMPLLTGEEYKVLIYATRRILGFQKRQDRISISQFTNGTKGKDNNVLDCGTGLSIETVKKCLAALESFGLMVRLQENDPRRNEGVLWGLQWDDSKVNWQELQDREARKSQANAERIAKARSMRQAHPPGQTGVSGTERTPASPTVPPPASGTETQKTEETQGNENINISINLFNKILEALKFTIKGNSMTFLKAANPVAFEDGVLTLSVADEKTLEWMESNAAKTINNALPGILPGQDATVRFVVMEEVTS